MQRRAYTLLPGMYPRMKRIPRDLFVKFTNLNRNSMDQTQKKSISTTWCINNFFLEKPNIVHYDPISTILIFRIPKTNSHIINH